MSSLSARWLITGITLATLATLAPAAVRSDRTHFSAVPGVQEFSGRMIARPMPLDLLAEEGLSPAQALTMQAAARLELARFSLVERVHQTDDHIFLVPEGMTENEVAGELMASGNFQYVEPDWILYPVACPNDPQFGSQWAHQANRMQSCDGWDLHTGDSSVSVGICDTGVLTTHEDLLLHRLEGYNAVDRLWESAGGDIGPIASHGTLTTGCAAANGNNGLGVTGVGWNLSHRMLRVSNSGGGAYLSVLQHAARTSVESGDRVASVSYSGVDSYANLTTATYIKSIGGLLCWAAGNDARDLTFGNRDDDDIIVVGATHSGDGLASYSNYGQLVDVVAPGSSILTTSSGHNADYGWASGTSLSCPLAAGLCTLLWSHNPSLTPDQIENALKQGCDDRGDSGVDDTYGYGRINAYDALVLVGAGGSPIANFTGTPTSGLAPLMVNFTDTSTGAAATSWYWTFGDTGTSILQNPTHTYTACGDYTVSLTAVSPGGIDTETKVAYISALPPAPIANFIASPTSGGAPLAVDFTDTSTGGTGTSWSWDFGDFGTSTLQNPSHTYTASGNYTVMLTVTGPGGSDFELKNRYITVSEPWHNLGSGLAGTHGIPLFVGDGTLSRYSSISFDLTNALQNSPIVLVLGTSAAYSPFKGGIMVPSTEWLLFGLSTDASGELSFSVWPNNPVPSGASVYLQTWITDAAGPFGFAASNCIFQIAP